MTTRSFGLRTQIIAMLLLVAIVPLGALGYWLTSAGVQSGGELLRDHLDASADRYVSVVESRWKYRRADIALIAGNDATLRAVTADSLDPLDREYLSSLGEGLALSITTIELHDNDGRVRWSSTPATRAAARSRAERDGAERRAAPAFAPEPARGPSIAVRETIRDGTGARLGEAVVAVSLAALAPNDSTRPLVPGGRASVRLTMTKVVLVPLNPGAGFREGDVATIGGETWFLTQRKIPAAALDVAIGAPLGPYVRRFQQARRLGIAMLIAFSLIAVVAATVLARRMSRPLEDLAAASGAIAGGDLARRAVTGGPAEVQRVGAAFNTMSENLRSTLEELSRQRALAAVGEFATSLSHDVRNALTSIKIDLDRAERRKVTDTVAQNLLRRAQNNVGRLEATVTGALQVARAGHTPPVRTDIRDAIRSAVETVSGSFSAIPATLDLDLSDDPLLVRGAPAALQQVFANLLFNAAQSLTPGGRTLVSCLLNDGFVEIAIADSGTGIDDISRLAEPFYSTKPKGSGLGLPIVRQILSAHGGALSIDSVPGRGTVVRVRIPALNDSSAAFERSVPSGSTDAEPIEVRNA